MTKVGIIRCMQTEDLCPGTTDFTCAATGKGVFAEIGPVEIVGFANCGGCPGKKAVGRAKLLVERGAEAIIMASCIGKGTPLAFPCPTFQQMKQAISSHLKPKITVYDYTH